MNFHIQDFVEGLDEILTLNKQGENIFEMKGSNLFPHNTSQKTWEYAKNGDSIHFSDGTHTYSFKGQLADYDSQLEKMPEVPLADIFTNATAKGKAQVHRSDPGSVYFTLQEGRNNPTYTLRHVGDNKWKAIPKPHKVKDKLKEPLTPVNVNLESVKEGMLKELELSKKAGVLGSIDHGLGDALHSIFNLPGRAISDIGSLGGPVPEGGDSLSGILGHAAVAGSVGAGAGGLYHLGKEYLYNTPEENEREKEDPNTLLRRMLLPAGAMAGANMFARQSFPASVNDAGKTSFV